LIVASRDSLALFKMSQRPGLHVPAIRLETEKSLGITQRSAAINFGWTGEIRKR
jgi:tRNA pseudouridine13 synthase